MNDTGCERGKGELDMTLERWGQKYSVVDVIFLTKNWGRRRKRMN